MRSRLSEVTPTNALIFCPSVVPFDYVDPIVHDYDNCVSTSNFNFRSNSSHLLYCSVRLIREEKRGRMASPYKHSCAGLAITRSNVAFEQLHLQQDNYFKCDVSSIVLF